MKQIIHLPIILRITKQAVLLSPLQEIIATFSKPAKFQDHKEILMPDLLLKNGKLLKSYKTLHLLKENKIMLIYPKNRLISSKLVVKSLNFKIKKLWLNIFLSLIISIRKRLSWMTFFLLEILTNFITMTIKAIVLAHNYH